MSVIEQIENKLIEIDNKANQIRRLLAIWSLGTIFFEGINIPLTTAIKTEMKARAITLLDEITVLNDEVKALIP